MLGARLVSSLNPVTKLISDCLLMKWVKKNLIYCTTGKYPGSVSHCQVPKPYLIDDTTLRIYYGTRDIKNITSTSFLEVEAETPEKILYVHNAPVMDTGGNGTFDEYGVMPGCFLKEGADLIMYYTGWSKSKDYPYCVFIGIARSVDGGVTFERGTINPVVINESISCSQPFVINMDSKWIMWYSSFTGWEMTNGTNNSIYEPSYGLRAAYSTDGLNWETDDIPILQIDENTFNVVNPTIWIENEKWHMLFSYRRRYDFRENPENSYRIGYAASNDGISWDIPVLDVLPVSDKGWDDSMISYPAVYLHKGKKYLLYNGNGFGKSGFGYAVAEE